MAGAIYFMVIMRITSLSANVHTVVTGLGIFGALLFSAQVSGGITISTVWALGNMVGHAITGMSVI
jgi:hypothetical protein